MPDHFTARLLRLRQILSLVLLTYFYVGCRSADDAPALRSSYEFRFDGTHCITHVGVPTRFDTLTLPLKTPATTAPLAIVTNDTENITLAQGKNILIGNRRSMHLLATSIDSTNIDELLADSSNLFAIHLDGAIEKFSKEGKIIWHANINSLAKFGSLLSSDLLVVSSDSAVFAYAANDGSLRWSYHSLLEIQSLCIDSKSETIYAALTANNADGTDSIICLKHDGSPVSRTGFSHTRITSNLCLCSNGKLAFGYLGSADEKTLLRAGHIALWSNLRSTTPNREWDHSLPYIISSVSANNSFIITGGFRETQGDMISGIDAFRLDDTGKYWQRRFTYPVVMPVTISQANAYIPFTITTQADVPAKTVLVTLDITDGSTLKELPITGAMSGFVPSVGMPVDGTITFADRSRARIYFFKP